ncbi:plasmid maintenance protein [Borreliella bissettiae]|uniref:plasmid maintenance protein n=1 Tax=Borrelia bissettiae TaxID=64897 RepID=UPI001E2C07B8|nr:plasmid maintenance protein [Borreliella bissettiae]MCD2401655.1 plasmid maintenance protein [Borreliella bissettiae]
MHISSTTKKTTNCHNKIQHKLIVLVSTIDYLNKKPKKYTQNGILYYFNENLKRNGQAPTTLRTMQKYIYKLEKEIKVTTNYHQHMGVNFGTEIYYKLNYPKKDCYHKINKYFIEKKILRFKKRVDNYFNKKPTIKMGSVQSEQCFNKNNIKKEKRNNQIEKYQVKNYYNKCNFKSKKSFSILNLDTNKKTKIDIMKIMKQVELEIIKSFNMPLNKPSFKNKQIKLKEILKNTQKQLKKAGYNNEQLETNFQKVYQTYKVKPHFIIENQKYNDLGKIKRKLERSIEIKKANLQKDCENIRTNIFNILVEQLRKEAKIKVLKQIVKDYLNNKKKLEYNKVFNTYYYELLEIIKKEKNLRLKEVV